MSEENVLCRKAQEFLKLKIPVHISFKQNFWKRGIITEVKSDFFILDETIEGTMPIFFQEIKEIKKFHRTKEEGI